MLEVTARKWIEKFNTGEIDVDELTRRLLRKSYANKTNKCKLPKQDKQATMTPSATLEEDEHGRWRLFTYWFHDFDTAVHAATKIWTFNPEQIAVKTYKGGK